MTNKQSFFAQFKHESRKAGIWGGTPVPAGKYPWMAAIVNKHEKDPLKAQFCGGSLIAPNWVLTASHCLFEGDLGPEDIVVRLGFINLKKEDAERIHVEEYILHPQYDDDTVDFDVALLRLAKNSGQTPIGIISAGDPGEIATPGTMATIMGWGGTETRDTSEVLLATEVPIVPHADAKKAYAKHGAGITKNMLAAGWPQGERDACQGDSGGPLVVVDENLNLVLAGVTSWGIGCADPGLPGLYAKLAVLCGWVRETCGI